MLLIFLVQAGLADAIANYKTLLTEVIRDPYASWRESRPRLERDPQGRGSHSLLDLETAERVFRDHTLDLEDAAIDSYIDLLEEKLPARVILQGSSLEWEDVEEMLDSDPRFHRVSGKKKESLWLRYVEDVKWNAEHPDAPPRRQRRIIRDQGIQLKRGEQFDRAYLETDRKRVKRS